MGVASVVDADTIEIHGQRIRFHGIDAPEGRQLCGSDDGDWRCGQRASNALAEKIGRAPVACEVSGSDRYGRFIAVCFQGRVDLNGWLVRNGWAMAYRRYSTDYVDDEDAARRNRLGIWRGRFVPPWDWRRGKR
ncbi:MAG: thermonuclease family protein [Minwuia sp.]|uniref:thermonuclease family protein n=1 Tax=Minwuia sp. TaxID=2493630 RepID=UPI003A83D13A